MDKKVITMELSEKLEANYISFMKEWLKLEPMQLIEKAEEIAATKLVYQELKNGGYDAEHLEYLLRFKNPLEVARDKWNEENGSDMVHDEDMSHALWSIADKQDAEQDYELAAEVEPGRNKNQPVTVRDFIEKHPDAAFDVMTPGGYVYLTPEKAQLLLLGQSVKGHPGSPEYAMEIPAEELLGQEVVNSNFADGAWHLLSDNKHEMEQEPSPLEQGVQMC
jgi:hypothetical protein